MTDPSDKELFEQFYESRLNEMESKVNEIESELRSGDEWRGK